MSTVVLAAGGLAGGSAFAGGVAGAFADAFPDAFPDEVASDVLGGACEAAGGVLDSLPELMIVAPIPEPE